MNEKRLVKWQFFGHSLLIIIFLFPTAIAEEDTKNATLHSRQKRQGLFSVVTFPNNPCRGNNNLNGTCVSASECVGTGGQAKGACAQGFGTCCFYSISTCGGTVTYNQTYIQNPGYGKPYTVSEDTTCTFTFNRINSDTCQLRLDFERFDLGGPFYSGNNRFECSDGNTDYVSFTAAGNRNNDIILCGYNPGQHLYIDMGSTSADPSSATMTMKFDATYQSFKDRYYNIMVSQIECNTNYAPPQGCGQYFFGNNGRGVIQTFNYDQTDSTYQAKLEGYYTVCIRREENMCRIGYTPPNVDSTPLGFAISGNNNFVRGRAACGNPAPGQCTDNYVRIPQGTSNRGNAPYFGQNPPTGNTGCDRFCGKRLCGIHLGCNGADHSTIYSHLKPFRLEVFFQDFPTSNTQLIGFQLNYFQERC